MKPRTVAIVIGTRPEAIKMAPLVWAFKKRRDEVDLQVVATGQHRQMLKQVLELFAIKPDVDLDLMRRNQRLADLTARAVTALERLWRRTPPAVVLVQGDTTSTFAASLAAYYLKVPIGHVEAGLRSHDKYAPFPEEINRRVVDVLADYCFAPTPQARANLLSEGVSDDRIYVTGNTGIDTLLATLERVRRTGFIPAGLDGLPLAHKWLILVTAHRRESIDSGGLIRICGALKTLAGACPSASILYAVHPNPNVRQRVRSRLGGIPNVRLTGPLDYQSFVYLMGKADVILTDSGGIQEEAPSLNKPVLVMRDVTERDEAVGLGGAELVGTDASRIVKRTMELLEQPGSLRLESNPFGDGRAAERIVRVILERTA
ncbi:MAG: UDP-N-acetylglucosamine 2-epimerase (non-hydrolyzing) [Candidatus Omnitrophica bacterium]|nr:UDP-N-acetylglucosamine 2-epimerase (non-hydrolyzing) [Candidatus Omnitrophota bacterium]